MTRQHGQAATEFLVVTAALVAALFVPFAGGESVASLLVRALTGYLRARSFLISIL